MWSITAKRLSWLSAFDFSLNGSLPIATYFLAAHAQVDATTAFGPNGEIIDEFNPASTFDWLDKNKNSTDDSDDWTMAKKLPLSHCFRGGSTNKDECFERGTLLLKPNSARIEDTPKFEEMRDGGSLKSLIEDCGFYSIKLKNTVEVGASSGKNAGTSGGPTYELLTSIPCSLLKIEDSHDSLEISLTPHGQVVSINYRTQPAWGLNLFEHTAVRLNKGRTSPSPVIPPKPVQKEGEQPAQEQGIMGFFRRYWWAFLIGFVILQFVGGQQE